MYIEEQIKEMKEEIKRLNEELDKQKMKSNWVTVKELSQIMKIAPSTIYTRIKEGHIKANTALGSTRVPLSQFEECEVNKKEKSMKEEIFG